MKDKIKFREYIALLSEKFEKEISQAYTKMIWESLRPFEDVDCERALKYVFLHGNFLKDLIPDLLKQLEGDSQAQAVEAWLIVDSAVKSHGNYQSVKFEDPVIHSVIKAMGGWVNFQDCEIKDWVWRQREFERLYGILKNKGNHPDYLPGQCEIENQALGFDEHIKPPEIISGDRQKLLSEG